MNKSPFEVLGVNENASAAEIQAAYMKLRSEYTEKMFKSGPEGEDAAKKLEIIDAAYRAALEMSKGRVNSAYSAAGAAYGNGGDGRNGDPYVSYSGADTQKNEEEYYARIEDFIKQGNLVEAQKMLDEMNSRTAEWHYLQSIVYYKKNWYLESKKQLGFALNMDPGNQKYKNAMDKLTRMMASKTINPESYTSHDYDHGRSTHHTGVGAGNGTCTGSCCGDVCLANLCCNCGEACCCR